MVEVSQGRVAKLSGSGHREGREIKAREASRAVEMVVDSAWRKKLTNDNSVQC